MCGNLTMETALKQIHNIEAYLYGAAFLLLSHESAFIVCAYVFKM